jgi:hypothetical protein
LRSLLAARTPTALPDPHRGRVLLDLDGSPFATLLLLGPAGAPVTEVIASADALEQALIDARRQEVADRTEGAVLTDGELDLPSGLGGTVYWRRVLAAEAARCDDLEHPASILLLRPYERGGEEWLAPTVAALRRSCRSLDLLARVDTGVLGVLAIECPATAAPLIAGRLKTTLLEEGVAVVIGTASREPGQPLGSTLLEAWKVLEDGPPAVLRPDTP